MILTVVCIALAYPAAVAELYLYLFARAYTPGLRGWNWPASRVLYAGPHLASFLRTALWPLFRGKVDAITSGRVTLMLVNPAPIDLSVHEYFHRWQSEHYGPVRFFFMYAWEYIRHGYYNNKYEIEAREYAASATSYSPVINAQN